MSLTDTAIRPPAVTALSTDPASPLVMRLVREFGAALIDKASVADWTALPGDRLLLLAGDAVRFTEGQNVAAVPRDSADAVARRYGSQRWPLLLFFRGGQYVTAIAGMQDWDVYLQGVDAALRMPSSRPPTIGIPVVSKTSSSDASCH
ncbi:hydrogenase [Cupriavidus sp. UYMSc13B]|nr:hydrogenase [Cupriavidus sp. UYMSc13B]